jgi:hypothetical protein
MMSLANILSTMANNEKGAMAMTRDEEENAVRNLGETIGYGVLMELAERLWHHPKTPTIGEPFAGLPDQHQPKTVYTPSTSK